MENWQTIILRMCDEGSSIEDIITYFNNPSLINETYVKNVIYSNSSDKKVIKRYWISPQKSIPASHTLSRKIYDKIQEIGGNEELLKLLETHSFAALSREWHLPWYAIKDYRNIFIRGRWNSIHDKPRKKSKHRPKTKLTIKDVRELW